MELSIIIVNYNGGMLVDACLESIYAHPPATAFEVVLIDNASTDGSGARVHAAFPALRYIANDSNAGLARAFNKGLAAAQGRYLLALDNDTRILPGALQSLLDFMDAHPDVGATGSLLLNPDLTPQRTFRRKPSALNAVFGRRSLITRLWPSNPLSSRYLMSEKGETNDPFEVDWVSTAALMVRHDVYTSVGGLDEDFFVYWVDADWCARIRAGSWKIFAVPASRVIHDENLKARRRARRNVRMLIDFHRGAYLYYRKNHARSALNPMAWIALIGLSLRAGSMIGWDYLKFEILGRFAAHGRAATGNSTPRGR